MGCWAFRPPRAALSHPRRVGDGSPAGMGVSTVTAARILKGQLQNRKGEESLLEMDKFPYVALAKVRPPGDTPNTHRKVRMGGIERELKLGHGRAKELARALLAVPGSGSWERGGGGGAVGSRRTPPLLLGSFFRTKGFLFGYEIGSSGCSPPAPVAPQGMLVVAASLAPC